MMLIAKVKRLPSLLALVYLEVCIWIGVRWEYWTNRLYIKHAENLEEVRWMLRSFSRSGKSRD